MDLIENKTFDEIVVGQSARIDRTLEENDILLFGVMSGDTNPTHFQSEGGAKGETAVVGHGLWSATLISNLLGNQLPGPGTTYKSQQLEFHRRVLLGDTISVSITVTGKNPTDKSVDFSCLAVNQRGENVFTGTASVYAPAEKIRCAPRALPQMKPTLGHHVFDKLIAQCKGMEPLTMAVCHPCDEVSLGGPIKAAEEGLIEPVLVGPKARILAVAEKIGVDISRYRIVESEHSQDSAVKSVALCRSGEVEGLIKGSLHTDEMMHAVTSRDAGLRTNRRISHAFVMDVPSYARMLVITDAAINIYPTLEDKVDILQNCIDLVQSLGIQQPKVAILSAVETVYPKITSTLDAAALCKMTDRGQITGALVDGPLAFDNAISAEAARIKKINSPVAGQADILLVPDLEAGNMLAKQLSYLADAEAAGIVLGARVPIVLTSRADSERARLASCAVAVLHARRRQEKLAVIAA